MMTVESLAMSTVKLLADQVKHFIIVQLPLIVRFCIVNMVKSVSSEFSSQKLIGRLDLSNIKT